MNRWIGVDLDGTLAEYHGFKGPEHIGPPVPAMLERVKRWLGEGRDVRIFTARVDGGTVALSMGEQAGELFREVEKVRGYIETWCQAHLGRVLPVTCVKDFGMVELWDARCVQVVPNEGRALRELVESYEAAVNAMPSDLKMLVLDWFKNKDPQAARNFWLAQTTKDELAKTEKLRQQLADAERRCHSAICIYCGDIIDTRELGTIGKMMEHLQRCSHRPQSVRLRQLLQEIVEADRALELAGAGGIGLMESWDRFETAMEAASNAIGPAGCSEQPTGDRTTNYDQIQQLKADLGPLQDFGGVGRGA